jgi:hypothetical protein
MTTTIERSAPVAGQRWKHYKGTVYTVVCIAQSTADLEKKLVIYRDGDKSYARPIEEFMEYVAAIQKPRFKQVSAGAHIPSNVDNPPICPYCQNAAQLVLGGRIYPHRYDLAELQMWLCSRCNAWVGCHKPSAHSDGTVPFGRLANAELRGLKTQAHAAFDPLWKNHGITRDDAYAWLAEELGLAKDLTHIGMFDEDTCRRVIELCITTDPRKIRALAK